MSDRRATTRGTVHTEEGAATPWWRHGFMWLVVGGPLAVIVAGTVTAVIAIKGADPVVETPASARHASGSSADVPALKARNHSATPAN